jgi:hypothetical protein
MCIINKMFPLLLCFFLGNSRRLNFIYRRFEPLRLFHLHRQVGAYLLCNRTHPYPVTLLPIGSGYFPAKPSPVWIPQLFSNLVIISYLPVKMEQSVPKRRHTKFRRRGITQKKTYRIRRKFEIKKMFPYLNSKRMESPSPPQKTHKGHKRKECSAF